MRRAPPRPRPGGPAIGPSGIDGGVEIVPGAPRWRSAIGSMRFAKRSLVHADQPRERRHHARGIGSWWPARRAGCRGRAPREAQDAPHVGQPPGVDRLVVVADHEQVALRLGQQRTRLELGAVHVLELVDADVGEPPCQRRRSSGSDSSASERAGEHAIEVDSAGGRPAWPGRPPPPRPVPVGLASLEMAADIQGLGLRQRGSSAASAGGTAQDGRAAAAGGRRPARGPPLVEHDLAGEGVEGAHLDPSVPGRRAPAGS